MIVSVADAAAAISGTSAGDTNFQRLVKAANAAVVKYCGRAFEHAERTELVEGFGWNDRVDGIVRSYVFLKEDPIDSLTEVRVDPLSLFTDDTIVTDLTQFVFDGNRLIWTAGYFPEGRNTVRVEYTAGYWPAGDTDPLHVPTMPEDLRDVVIQVIAARVARGTSERMKSESLGEYSYTRFENAFEPLQRATLANYRSW